MKSTLVVLFALLSLNASAESIICMLKSDAGKNGLKVFRTNESIQVQDVISGEYFSNCHTKETGEISCDDHSDSNVNSNFAIDLRTNSLEVRILNGEQKSPNVLVVGTIELECN